MNKSSLIRNKLEEYGFIKVNMKNCFLAYTDEYCFEIVFEKVSYGTRWKIECNIYILREKGLELGKCPSSNEELHAINGLSVSMEQWDTSPVQMNYEKQQYEDKVRTSPDVYSESIILVFDEYIMPYFTWISLFTQAKDSNLFPHLKLNNKMIDIDYKMKFKSKITLKKYDNIHTLIEIEDFKPLFKFFEASGFQIVKQEYNKLHYKNEGKNIHIIINLEHHLFISFLVYLPKNNSKEHEELITYFKDNLFSFGWFIGNKESIKKNLFIAIAALEKYLNNPSTPRDTEKSIEYKELKSFNAEEILKKQFGL